MILMKNYLVGLGVKILGLLMTKQVKKGAHLSCNGFENMILVPVHDSRHQTHSSQMEAGIMVFRNHKY